MILESEILEYPEHEVKSKIGNMFLDEKILEEYSVQSYKIDPYFCERYKEKIQVDKNGCKYILFRIEVYFTEYLLAKIALEKKLGRKFIRINTSKEGYDVDHEASSIRTFISKFKGRQLKKLNKKLKELEGKMW